jgi:hypothetical protein
MEKTIKIDNKDVRFRCTAGTFIRYKQQFNTEFIADIAKLQECIKTNKSGVVTNVDYTKLSLDVFYQIAWACAKTADNSIPDSMTWLDSFDSFPIMDILPEILELVSANLKMNIKIDAEKN